MRPRVFVSRRIPDIAFDLLEPVCDVTVHEANVPPSREEFLAYVKGCDGVLSLLSDRIDASVCDAAGPQLKVVSNFAVGYNNIDVPALLDRQIAIGNTPDILTDATADIAVALLLSAARRLGEASRDVKAGRWGTWKPMGWVGQDFVSAAGPKTLGILGMGRIGLAVARRLHHGWGLRVLYTSQTPKPEIDEELGSERVDMQALLQQSDFLSVHVPLNDETTHLIGAPEFQLMKPSAVFVNTSRGPVVDQDALVDALRDGQIFAAGLDVCTPEPLPPENPLLALDNCYVLPHIGSATRATRNAMAERAAQNVLAGVRGEPLPYPVA